MKRDLISLLDFSREEIEGLFARAAQLKKGAASQCLAGKSIALIFEKSSTRTRVSFEVGVYQLGGHPIFLSSANTQMKRGEPIIDTARTLSRYCQGIVYRCFRHEDLDQMAKFSSVPVINALSDIGHPCQVLTDLFSLYERKPDNWREETIAWIGDGNNMANSFIEASILLDLHLKLAVPVGYEPSADLLREAEKQNKSVVLVRDPAEAVEGAGVVCTDVWASMGDEREEQQRKKDFTGYTVDSALLAKAGADAVVMHCLPAHRGEEITNEVVEGEQSIIFDQAENRLHLQKALMEMLLS